LIDRLLGRGDPLCDHVLFHKLAAGGYCSPMHRSIDLKKGEKSAAWRGGRKGSRGESLVWLTPQSCRTGLSDWWGSS